jgi:hypothetical protein
VTLAISRRIFLCSSCVKVACVDLRSSTTASAIARFWQTVFQ